MGNMIKQYWSNVALGGIGEEVTQKVGRKQVGSL